MPNSYTSNTQSAINKPRTSTEIKQEIQRKFGFFPAWLAPALSTPQVLENLWQQTLSSNVNNPLPVLFKEKLFAYLARFCSNPYFVIGHSCTLYSLGMTGDEIWQLHQMPTPTKEADLESEIKLLSKQPLQRSYWQSNSAVEISVLRCAILLFNQSNQAPHCQLKLRQFLGAVMYSYLLVLLGYIKMCHQWGESNPDIVYQDDPRVKRSLATLLLEEPRLAQFFQDYHQQAVKQNNFTLAPVRLSSQLSHHLNISEKLLAGFDNAPFPMMIYSSDGKILQINHAWTQSTGYSLEEIATLSEWYQRAKVKSQEIVQTKIPIAVETYLFKNNWFDLIKGQSTAQSQGQKRSLNANSIPDKDKIMTTRSELNITNKDNQEKIWDLYSAPLAELEDGTEVVVAIATDVTNRIRTETALWQTETRLNMVLEATGTGLWDWEIATDRVTLSQAAKSILGLETGFDDSFAGFTAVIHPEERASVVESIKQAAQTGEGLELEYPIIIEDRFDWLKVKAQAIYNAAGELVSLSGIVLRQQPDDSRTTEPVLYQEVDVPNSTLAKIFDALPYYIYIIKPNLHLSWCNQRFASAVGQDAIALLEKTLADLAIDNPQYWQQQIQQVFEQGEIQQQEETVRLAQQVYHFETIRIPLKDENGQIEAVINLSAESTESTQTKTALFERTAQLEAANQELESFSYSVSHDLQAPLRVIDGFSKVLAERYTKHLDERALHYLERIRANSQRMGEIIDDLLQLSRITRSQIQRQTVNLSTIAQQISSELSSSESQRQVEFEIAPNLVAEADPRLMRIVLENLFGNAWKYSSNNNFTRIEFGSTHIDDQTTYYVKDNGAGFDMKYADKLFIAFQRLHSETEFTGNGIGLATVKRIILKHRGKVWAEGAVDEGATFYFTL